MSRLALAVLVPGLFVCVFSTQEAVTPNSKCSGYTKYKDAGGYLMYHEMPVTFDDAKKRCDVEGGVLASPINNGIKAAMVDILKTRNVRKNVYTGFSAEINNGGIFSSIKGTQLSNIEHTWAPGEPNNYKNNEHCIVLSPLGTMSDVNCNNRNPYFCFLSEVEVETMGVCSSNFRGYASLDNTTGSCYKWHSDKLDFDESVKVCEQERGHLLIINGDNEAQAVKNLVVKNNEDYAHIGFQLNKNPRKWVTIQGETIEDAGYAKWQPGQTPDKAAPEWSTGVLGKDGLLGFILRSFPLSYICEKDPKIVICE